MITTPTTTAENLPEQPAVPSKNGWPPLWRRLALAVVMLVSIFMNFYQLGQMVLVIFITLPRSGACSIAGITSFLSLYW